MTDDDNNDQSGPFGPEEAEEDSWDQIQGFDNNFYFIQPLYYTKW